MKKTNKHSISWKRFEKDMADLITLIRANEIRMRTKHTSVYGIPRGGLIIAVYLSHHLDVPLVTKLRKVKKYATLVCDELVDSGAQLSAYRDYPTATLYRKSCTRFEPDYCIRTINKHIIFPWERS